MKVVSVNRRKKRKEMVIKMKAAVWHGYKDIRIEEVPRPVAGAGSVIVKIDYAGICGTDRHEYVGPNFIPVEKPHRLTGKTAPLIPGHEFSGRIYELGPGVSGWKIGDRVTANGTLACGTCEMCRSGRYNICERLGFLGVGDDGAFAQYAAVKAERLFAIPEGVTQRHAPLAEPLACGIHATKLLGGVQGKRVLVIGPGIIGLGCFFAAKLAGAKSVLVSGIGKERRTLVEENGGIYFDSGVASLEDFIREWSGGSLADVAYECVGSQRTLDTAIRQTKPGGKVMVMGVFEKPPTVDLNTLQEAERMILTSQAHVDEIAVALEYLREGKINGDRLITGEVTLDTLVADGFEELLRHPEKHIKLLLHMT